MRVLVARLDSDGDVLLAGPAIRAVAAGADHVTLLCGPRGRSAAELLPGVDEVLCRHAEWIDPEPRAVDAEGTRRFVEELASRDFDQAIVLTSFHQSPLPLALLLRLAGVPAVAATSVDYPGSLLDVRHVIDDDVHEVERSLSLVGKLGYSLPASDNGSLQVVLHATPANPARGAPYVIVHPGASVPARAWKPRLHADLVDALLGAGRRVVVTGAPGERAVTRFVARAPRDGVLDLGGSTSLAQLGAVLADADAIVVGNTGPAHLAAAVGTPVVSLFAPTVPAVRWGPWQVPHALLHTEVPCAGCRARECPVAGHPCIDRVTVEQVMEAIGWLAPVPYEAMAA